MATNFPGSQDSFTNPTSSSAMNSPSHASQHADVNDAVEAIELALLDGAPMYIDDTNERVGIGTTTPQYALHVNAGAANTGLLVQSTDGVARANFSDNATTGNNYVGIGAVGDDLRFFSGNATQATLDENGNFGIGTTNPSAELDVVGDATFSGDVTYANQGLVLLSETTISSGSSSVTVSSVFSSTYENYKIVFSKIYGTSFGDIRFKFAAGGTGYYWSSRSKSIQGSTDDDNGNYFGSGTDWWIGYSSTNTQIGNGIDINIYSPNDAGFTGYSGTGTGGGYHYSCGGYKNNTTSYTGFRINPASGTFSGGEIRVYGIKGT